MKVSVQRWPRTLPRTILF